MPEVTKLDDLPVLPSTRFRKDNHCCSVGKYYIINTQTFYPWWDEDNGIDKITWRRETLIGVTHNAPWKGSLGRTALLVQREDDLDPVWFHIRDWRIYRTWDEWEDARYHHKI